METDGPTDTKTHERTEVAATAVQAMNGDNVSIRRVDFGPGTASTSFGVTADPPVPHFREDVLVDNGAAATKSCLLPFEMRSPTAAGGSLLTGKPSMVTRTTYNQSPIRLYSTEETNSKKTNLRTPILSVSYDSSFFWKNDFAAAPSYRRVIETKSGYNWMFDPGGAQYRLRFCSFLGTWRALICVEVIRFEVARGDLQRFLGLE